MVTLVIPVFLRAPPDASMLARCLAAVEVQEGLDRIILVDDASPLALPPLPARVELLRQPANRGPAAARNRGVERALALGARTILFTDHDCVPDPGWARALSGFLAGSRFAGAGGVTRSLGTTLLDRYHDYAGTLNGRWLRPGYDELLFAPTCNLGVRAEALGDVRFDERFPGAAGEDFEFCWRLRRTGPIALVPSALVRHDFGYRSTLGDLSRFLDVFRRYSCADALVWEKHPETRGLSIEACAAADLLARVPPADPAAYRRNSTFRVRPRRLVPAMKLLKHFALRAYRHGRRSPQRWRE